MSVPKSPDLNHGDPLSENPTIRDAEPTAAPWDLDNAEFVVEGAAPVVTSATLYQDATLSMKAKGIYATALALAAEGERITAKTLASRGTEKKDALDAGLHELRRAGWVELISWVPPKSAGMPRMWVHRVYREPRWTADPLCVFPGQPESGIFRLSENPAT